MKATVSNVSPFGMAVTTRSIEGRNRYISGTPSELPTVARCPRAHSALASANVDPRQSPSGASWLRRRMLRRLLSVSATVSAGDIAPPLSLDLGHLAQQALHAHTPLDRFVQLEEDLGDVAEPDPPAQFLPDEPLGIAEGGHGLRLGLRAAQVADDDLGMPHVHAQLHIRHGDKADPGVLHLALENRADLLLELLPEPLSAHAHERFTASSRPRSPGRRGRRAARSPRPRARAPGRRAPPRC